MHGLCLKVTVFKEAVGILVPLMAAVLEHTNKEGEVPGPFSA